MRSTLRLNGLPARATYFFFNKLKPNATQLTHSTSISFVSGISEKIIGVLNEAGVRVAMRPFRTIGFPLP